MSGGLGGMEIDGDEVPVVHVTPKARVHRSAVRRARRARWRVMRICWLMMKKERRDHKK